MYTLYIVYSLVVVASVKSAYSGRWSMIYKLLTNVPPQMRDTKSNTTTSFGSSKEMIYYSGWLPLIWESQVHSYQLTYIKGTRSNIDIKVTQVASLAALTITLHFDYMHRKDHRDNNLALQTLIQYIVKVIDYRPRKRLNFQRNIIHKQHIISLRILTAINIHT